MNDDIRLIDNVEEILDNARRYLPAVDRVPELRRRVGMHPHWHFLHDAGGAPLAMPSKFGGYAGMDGELYVANSRAMNGRDTKAALRPFFDELPRGSIEYRHYRDMLENLLAVRNCRLKRNHRLFILKPQFQSRIGARGAAVAMDRADTEPVDRILAAASHLSEAQRADLRARL